MVLGFKGEQPCTGSWVCTLGIQWEVLSLRRYEAFNNAALLEEGLQLSSQPCFCLVSASSSTEM